MYYWASVRTAFKDDVGCTAAELVYGTTLRLPGEFFDQSKSDSATDKTTYVTQLRTAMRCLQAVPTRLPQHRRTHISNDLATCTHVFVRNDAVRKPLQLRTMAHSLFSSGVLSITQSIIMGSQLPFPSIVSSWHIWIQPSPRTAN